MTRRQDVVPQCASDAEARILVAEMVLHVMITQLLEIPTCGLAMVNVIVGEVVRNIPNNQPRHGRQGRCQRHQRVEDAVQNRAGDESRDQREHQAALVKRELMVLAVQQKVEPQEELARTQDRAVEDESVQHVFCEGPEQETKKPPHCKFLHSQGRDRRSGDGVDRRVCGLSRAVAGAARRRICSTTNSQRRIAECRGDRNPDGRDHVP
mmetsp:Transcript_15748/g.40758  ORF Transcript_15748/g.40758 Transcript_15748/m.40758 type:complete len:209 (+) Transcript_15748:197-823(+)